MAHHQEDDGLLAIDLGPDSYASTAATDSPSVPNLRTHQSETAFAQIKASYTAKTSTGVPGSLYADLLRAVPALASTSNDSGDGGKVKTKLGKREQMLLGYVVGEMYYNGEYTRVVTLCERVGEVCAVDGKLARVLQKWKGRAGEKSQEL